MLLLSSEDIAEQFENFALLKQNLSRWSDDVEIVAYFRDPVSYYRSVAQHHVKSQFFVPSPQEWCNNYTDIINNGKLVFGERFHARALNRTQLYKKSITEDVLKICNPNLPKGFNFDTIKANISNSAEVSVVSQNFMQQFQPSQKTYGSRNTQLRKFLKRFSAKNGLIKPVVLKKDVKETLLSLYTDDLVSLRDEHGVIFEAIDYENLGKQKASAAALNLNRIADLFEID